MEDLARVLLILSQDVLARSRVLAGQATATMKLPVSLQIVLRALIEEGLKPKNRPSLLTTIEVHARAIHEARRRTRRRSDVERMKRTLSPNRPESRSGPVRGSGPREPAAAAVRSGRGRQGREC